jgi:hypothetical protein
VTTDPSAEDQAGAVTVAYVHEKNLAASFHHCMIEMIGWDLAHEARIIRGGYKAWTCGTDGLVDSRNKLVAAWLAEDTADWLFWIDTDMGFAPDTVDRLMAAADPAERPVVGGLCFTQREETSDGMGGWRCRATPTVFDWTVLEDTGQMGFSVRWNYPPDQLTRVAGTGSACILIHRSVFEKIQAKYGTWYDRVPNTTMGQVISEDLSLCLRACALDIPIHVHTGIKTTHQKTLWLAEDDYYGQVALSQLTPPVPPATEATAVVVPVLRRPQNAAPFMESLIASDTLARVYAVADADDPDTAQAWKESGATVLTWHGPSPGTFAQKANIGYRATTEPWLLLAGDDVKFHPGWLDQAQAAARDGADVIGTNDLHNPRVTAGDHSPHPMIRRAYIDEQGASWDGPGTVAHEGYAHWFVDDEIVTAAKQRDTWAMAFHSKIEHLHPLWGLAADDETYALGREHIEQDKALFEKRLAEHG